nr:site-specific integrase [Pseudomonas sp. ADAK13]
MRDRLILSLAYCGALRRAELVALRVEDLDVAHRLISVRAETTKGRLSRVVCYTPAIAPRLDDPPSTASPYRVDKRPPVSLRFRPQPGRGADTLDLE